MNIKASRVFRISAPFIGILVASIGAVVWFMVNQPYTGREERSLGGATDPNTPPLFIKQFDRLMMDYGFFIPASSASQEKFNPQPTFILPLGTKVRSLVDGVVVEMPKLYSHDYSIMVAADDKSQWRYETEHVINPVVKVGDHVTAGQVVAEVSDYDKGLPTGFGLVEIGLLRGGNPPRHICPYQYLDSSVKAEILGALKSFYQSWEEYKGDSALYDETVSVTGCLTTDGING